MVNKQRHRTKRNLTWRQHLLNTFFPRHNNSYRPHLISRYGLVAMALAMTGAVGLTLEAPKAVLGDQATITPSSLLDEINIERTKAGKTNLVSSPELTKAAYQKGKDMLANQYWAHVSPTGTTPWMWVSEQDYQYAYAGENLARNFANTDATVAAWMASPSHRDNLLHDYYTEAGFAVVDGMLEGTSASIVVALFATPASSLTKVAGVTTETAPVGQALGPLAQFGVALQAMNPAVLGALSLILVGISVAGMTFTSTHLKAFRPRRNFAVTSADSDNPAWHQHHTVVKTIGMMTLAVACLIIFSSGRL